MNMCAHTARLCNASPVGYRNSHLIPHSVQKHKLHGNQIADLATVKKCLFLNNLVAASTQHAGIAHLATVCAISWKGPEVVRMM